VLVDLDRVDAAVAALEAVLGGRAREAAEQVLDAILEDAVEVDGDGEGDAAAAQVVDQLLQVDRRLALLGAGPDLDVAALVDAEVAAALG